MTRSIKETTVKLRNAADFVVDNTVSVSSGRPLVELRPDDPYFDPYHLTPGEARALARALTKHADAADAKRDARTELRRKGRTP